MSLLNLQLIVKRKIQMNIDKVKLQKLIADVPEAPKHKEIKNVITKYAEIALGVYVGIIIAKRVLNIKF